MAIKSRKVRYLLIVGALLTGGGAGVSCSAATPVDGDGDVDSAVDGDGDLDGDSDVDGDGDLDGDADGDVDVEPDGDVDPWSSFCVDPWQSFYSYDVALPDEGVEPTRAAICAEADPVESSRAGRVTFTFYSASPDRVTGQVQVPEELRSLVVGLPSFEVIEGWPATIREVTFTELAATEQGFGFLASWAVAPELTTWDSPSLGLRVTLTLRCDDGGVETRQVRAVTYLNLCFDVESRQPLWVSSGESCTVCQEMCEMAPSPIIPKAVADGTALARALRLEITPLARVGSALLLLAEHEGAAGPVRYQWSASSGELSGAELGGVLWEPPPGGGRQLLQLVLRDDDSAAVASFRWPT